MYDEIINHPSTSDELRRSTEAKLFRYRLKYLKALPVNDPKKETTFKVVDEMMRGMVLLEIPDELVWTQFMESKNAGQLGMLLFLSPSSFNRSIILQMNIISRQCVDILNSSPCLRWLKLSLGSSNVRGCLSRRKRTRMSHKSRPLTTKLLFKQSWSVPAWRYVSSFD